MTRRALSPQPSLLKVERNQSPGEKQDKDTLLFGKTFTDHMLNIDWDSEKGWHEPRIMPYGDLRISPAASSLHYGLQASLWCGGGWGSRSSGPERAFGRSRRNTPRISG